MNVRLQGNVTMENRLAQNMQNLISYGQLQDGVLKNMGELVARMTELASHSINTIQSSEDRASYQREFLDLVDQFEFGVYPKLSSLHQQVFLEQPQCP